MDSQESPNPRPGRVRKGSRWALLEEKTPGGYGFKTRRTGSIFGNFKFHDNRVLKNGHEPDCVLMFGVHLARIKFFFGLDTRFRYDSFAFLRIDSMQGTQP